MTSAQKVIKYAAMAFAIFLIVNIISAIIIGLYILGNAFGLVNSMENTITDSENNGSVVIKEENHNWLSNGNNRESSLIIYIPEDMIALDEIKLEAGAGEITIDTLKTQGLYFNLGAGKVHIENIIATKEAKIDGGVGNITINFEGSFKRI